MRSLRFHEVLAAVACLAQFVAAQPTEPPSIPSQPYVWRNVVIGGGGFVTGIIFHPRQRNLMYARTDVGGAYRWEASSNAWIPLTDWIGAADANLTGIESLALDPADPNRVYLAAGTYEWSPAAILRSTDQGRTFQRTDVPFRMGANELGRFNGERLAVDPNQGEILFFGSRSDGLWRSADRAVTWRKVESLSFVTGAPDLAGTSDRRPRFREQPVGIVCVLFDPSSGKPGEPTPTLYTAVSTTTTNLYRSTDAGSSWQPVTGQPLGLRPNHLVLATDGLLYVSYGREPGPNSMTDGAVWKFDPKQGAWTDITPIKPSGTDQRFGYGAVAVDAERPATVMVTTFARWIAHDEIFRSTNGGATWMPLLAGARWDHSSAPYTESRTPHWMGDIEINPFNPDQALFTTGYGIWECTNAAAADAGLPTHWVFLDHGLEETVPLALISPPGGAHLLSGVGDIDGFYHAHLNVSPAQGSFAGPRFGNTEDMAYAERKPNVIVRVGTARPDSVRAAISMDGGESWEALAREPAGSGGAGSIAISADGGIIVWTPRRGKAHYTTDRGTNWSVCLGLSSNVRVIADPVDARRFYAFEPRSGQLLVSTNGAAGFIAVATTLPAAESFPGRFGGGGEGAILYAAPRRQADLWLLFRRRGLYHSTDAGLSFARVSQIEGGRSLGFGKAPAGKAYPALYLYGNVGGPEALFRSDDAGASWVRINDDQHQYGSVNHVTGDPRIYGRVYFATGGRGIIYGDPAQVTN